MDDDAEQLDWGHDEEDAAVVQGSLPVDDAEDTVSLGGDDDDEFLAYQSRVPQDTARRDLSPPKATRQPKHDPVKAHSQDPLAERKDSADPPSSSGHTLAFGPLVHALPPKPVVATVSFVYPSHPSLIEATAMASRADRDKRNGAVSKTGVLHDPNESLPPGWELKHPRNGRGVYYYNIHTQESTWTRPIVPAIREKRGERSDHRDDPLDKPLPTRNDEPLIPRVGRADSGVMSYDDRHYRPGESGRREERPAAPSQLIDSYVPDSYSPNNTNNRPSPPPARARERNPSPPPRRPLSPAPSYGDRDSQTSQREVSLVSTQDRVWVARESLPQERPKERRQRDDPTPPQTERRDSPRDTGRSSTLRPRSPASYTRQESAPHSSTKPAPSVSEAPSYERRGRFSQVDAPVQPRRRRSPSRDVGMRRTRTDDISHMAHFMDDVPNTLSALDVRGDDDAPIRLALDAQRQESRKRAALPSQDEVFRPSARPPPTQRGGYPLPPASSAPASVPETRRKGLDDLPRDSARRTPSPPQPGPPPNERGDRDRGRSRWTKLHVNGPPQMDSHAIHESSRSRAHDVVMDVDDASLPRLSDPPTRPAPPKRPLQDEVPRYPRAMLNPDGDGPSRSLRETRDGIESRHRFPLDDTSRFGPSRDRHGFERHLTEQSSTQKEPVRSTESKPPPSGSNVKLSGTNNIPIGARNKFGANPPPPTMPSNSGHRASTVASGSNGEPLAPRRDRIDKDLLEWPPHLDAFGDDRGVSPELTRRENVRRSPPNKPRALPASEPAALPGRPSRAALGMSRFGPPIIKENAERDQHDQLTEPVRPQMSVSSESVPSEQIPEDSSRASPPPPSRESSMVSFKDVAAPPGRPAHLPPRPVSPSGGHRYRSGDTTKSHRPTARSPGISDSRGNEVNTERPDRQRSPSPSSAVSQKRVMDTYPGEPMLTPRDNRNAYSPELSRTSFRDSQIEHLPATRAPTLPPPAIQDEGRAPPPMHPERALMLQANGLPPRPPSTIGRVRAGRGPKRPREDHDRDRAEPLRGNSGGHYGSISPAGNRRRYPEDNLPGHGSGGGGSLLDRLTLDDGRVNSPSLRDRVQLPTKRDREEMLTGDFSFDMEGEDYDGSKRMRRRGGPRGRKGRI